MEINRNDASQEVGNPYPASEAYLACDDAAVLGIPVQRLGQLTEFGFVAEKKISVVQHLQEALPEGRHHHYEWSGYILHVWGADLKVAF